ncbi:DUF6266 family protein [Pedobacter gandavensis]|uniref:DUF6266 family protein n=1 Tax=Pedobacter gandavensis TaxID=2679963 RepID=UPI00292E4383|nr:DUF6266 family protein [Pedobacter gandavensis]
MGRLNNGLFGGFQGRVGNLVGYMLNGKPIIRLIGHSTKPLSPARKANCQKMTVINDFLRPHLNFIRTGFRLITAGTDRNFYNEAVSYNKKHAVQGVFPNITMDYTKALVSMGNLLPAAKTEISKHKDGIEFKWEVPADLLWEHRNDRAMLLIHFPDAKVSTAVMSGSRRHEGREVVAIDPSLAESRIEAYISFINEDATEISDSVHAGSLNHFETNSKETKSQETPSPQQPTTPVHQQKSSNKTPQRSRQQNKSFHRISSRFNSSNTTHNYTYTPPPS